MEPFNRPDSSQKVNRVIYSVAIVAIWCQH